MNEYFLCVGFCDYIGFARTDAEEKTFYFVDSFHTLWSQGIGGCWLQGAGAGKLFEAGGSYE